MVGLRSIFVVSVLFAASAMPLAAQVEISAPSTVSAGAMMEVSWSGGEDPRDFLTVVEAGAAEGQYGSYSYAESASWKVAAPEVAGDYEIRYLAAASPYPTLARKTLQVLAVSATLEVPASVSAGDTFQVQWTGPDNPKDFVTIVAAGAPERTYGSYAYTSEGSPLTLPAPEDPGDYEVRYLTGAKYYTLAAAPISVGGVTATLDGPDRVTAGEAFKVSWTGPDNPRDFIAVAPVGSPPDTWPSYEYTERGNPLTVVAPLESGDYELRYHTGRKYTILATAAIQVDPAQQRPGKLRVLDHGSSETAAGLPDDAAVELILDASGSMLQKLGGTRRIDIAKEVLIDLTQTTIPAGTAFAMRVFGHRESGSCRTDLESPLGPLDPDATAALIRGIEAKNLAKTPLARSLELVQSDLAPVTGQRIVVLITDGEETCDGDPAAAIEMLRATGVEVRVSVVGFAIDDAHLKQEFSYWASLGGGSYFDADSADQLGESLTRALRMPFDVLAADGAVVGSGLVNGDAIDLPAGQYRISTRESPSRVIEKITVIADETVSISLEVE